MSLHFGKRGVDWIESGHWTGAGYGGRTFAKRVGRHWGVSLGPWFIGLLHVEIDYKNSKVSVETGRENEIRDELRRLSKAIDEGRAAPLVFNDAHTDAKAAQ